MAEVIVAEMRGIITAVDDWCNQSFVLLDEERDGLNIAAIEAGTEGRAALANKSSDGSLHIGTRVVIPKFRKGLHAFVALEVKAA